MISGALFLNPKKSIEIGTLYRKYICRIVIAFVFWSFIYAFVKYQIEDISLWQMIESMLPGHYHLWFLFAITFVYMLLPLLKKAAENDQLLKYLILLWLAFLCMQTFKLVPKLSQLQIITPKVELGTFCGYIGYYLFGYYLHSTKFSKRQQQIAYALGALGVLSTILLSSFTSIYMQKPFGGFHDTLTINVMLESLGVFVFFKYKFADFKISPKMQKLFSSISKCSFAMYLVHDLLNILFRRIGFSIISFSPILSVPLFTSIIFIASYAIAYVISNVPVIGKYIS